MDSESISNKMEMMNLSADYLRNLKKHQFNLIDYDAFKKIYERGNVLIIDIRNKEDYEHIHFEGSIHYEWHDSYKIFDLDKDSLLEQKMSLGEAEDKELVVVCYSGQSSMQIATMLTLCGYKARSLLDGMVAVPTSCDFLVKQKS